MPVRKIIHIDMDAFYASVEQRDDPQLRGKPVIVAWRGSRSVVCAASYEVRQFGVRSAMPAVRAERLCPNGIFVAPDFTRYRTVSRQVREILTRHTDLIEPLSLGNVLHDHKVGTDAVHIMHELPIQLVARFVDEPLAIPAPDSLPNHAEALAGRASDYNVNVLPPYESFELQECRGFPDVLGQRVFARHLGMVEAKGSDRPLVLVKRSQHAIASVPQATATPADAGEKLYSSRRLVVFLPNFSPSISIRHAEQANWAGTTSWIPRPAYRLAVRNKIDVQAIGIFAWNFLEKLNLRRTMF